MRLDSAKRVGKSVEAEEVCMCCAPSSMCSLCSQCCVHTIVHKRGEVELVNLKPPALHSVVQAETVDSDSADSDRVNVLQRRSDSSSSERQLVPISSLLKFC
jgi:hypothetical protein